MFQPRNSLVLVRLFKKPDEQVGKLVVPTGNSDYSEAEIVAVGPDFPQAEGGVSGTSDITPGQRVFVKTHRQVGPGRRMEEGLRLRPKDQTVGDEGELWLFEQTNIIAIVGVG